MLSVFISSTFADLQVHRREVIHSCHTAGYTLEAMEYFSAQPTDAVTASLDFVAKADVLVGIYAWRYGYIPAGDQISITEQEFNHALALKKPALCFFVDPKHHWDQNWVDGADGFKKLTAFRLRVEKMLVRQLFTTPADLANKVLASLSRLKDDLPAQPTTHQVIKDIKIGGSVGTLTINQTRNEE